MKLSDDDTTHHEYDIAIQNRPYVFRIELSSCLCWKKNVICTVGLSTPRIPMSALVLYCVWYLRRVIVMCHDDNKR